MKGLSIRLKLTLWFTVALLLVVFFSYFIVFSVNRQIIQKTIQDSLIETVEDNVDEIEYYESQDIDNDTDIFITFRDGYLEIDDDFLAQVNGVYTVLYNSDTMQLLYGKNPISEKLDQLPFKDSKVQSYTEEGIHYYIFDRQLTANGLEGLWLRGIVSRKQGMTQMSDVIRLSLLLLPLLVVISVMGGYLLAKQMLRPIQEISESASQIRTGGDLKRRIELGEGKDELHQLADSFNGMFQRLEDAFEREQQFTSDVSHELRTPVSVIKAQCEYILEATRKPEEYENALYTIQRQNKKMAKLIQDMLDFSRLEMGTDHYVREQLNMTELVESVCFDLALIREKDIVLEYEAQKDVVCNGNRQLLSRLLGNLVSNAYRYGKENGHIYVRLQQDEQSITLSVEDDGMGIAPEEQSKIFQRFYQADNSHTGNGTGLGLSMVYEIAQFHHGEIKVESCLGEGSTFIFKFLKEF